MSGRDKVRLDKLKVAIPFTAVAVNTWAEPSGKEIVIVTNAVDVVTTLPLLVSIETGTAPRFSPAAMIAGIAGNTSWAACAALAVTVNEAEACVSPLLVAVMV